MAPKTVKQLIEELQKLPDDVIVTFEGEYPGDYRYVYTIDYQRDPSWGREANTVLLK